MATCEFAECNIGVFLGGEGKRERVVGSLFEKFSNSFFFSAIFCHSHTKAKAGFGSVPKYVSQHTRLNF